MEFASLLPVLGCPHHERCMYHMLVGFAAPAYVVLQSVPPVALWVFWVAKSCTLAYLACVCWVFWVIFTGGCIAWSENGIWNGQELERGASHNQVMTEGIPMILIIPLWVHFEKFCALQGDGHGS
jgi:hypothetical protein